MHATETEAPAEGRLACVARPEDKGERLDRFLARNVPSLSRTRLKGLILDGRVSIDGAVQDDPGRKVDAGQEIAVDVPPAVPPEPEGEEIPLEVVYEDDDLIVIDKPAGLVVHPAAGHETGTLVNALIAHCGDSLSGIGGVKRPGIVHRLDKDTTGLMVVAKTDRAHQGLAEQFADHGRTGPLERAYLAIVWGVPDRQRGTIDAPTRPLDPQPREDGRGVARDAAARRSPTTRSRRCFAGPTASPWRAWSTAGWRPAAPTRSACTWRISATRCSATRLYGSGFTHQGDACWRRTRRRCAGRFGRQALHAAVLGFAHPATGEELMFRERPAGDLGSWPRRSQGVVRAAGASRSSDMRRRTLPNLATLRDAA